MALIRVRQGLARLNYLRLEPGAEVACARMLLRWCSYQGAHSLLAASPALHRPLKRSPGCLFVRPYNRQIRIAPQLNLTQEEVDRFELGDGDGAFV